MSPGARLVDRQTGRVLLQRLHLARTPWSRLRGLLGRGRLGADEGLWLEPCNSVHMFGMTFAIDVVFLDRAGTVVRILPHLRPWHVGPLVWGARVAVELPDGAIRRLDIRLGQHLDYELAAEPAAG